MDGENIKMTDQDQELARNIFARAAAASIESGGSVRDFESIAWDSIKAAMAYKKVNSDRRSAKTVSAKPSPQVGLGAVASRRR
ncbi:hypothetical protein [Stenotrophomonas maltophilia]|uniref:hypothetical protein n=1 Tax=Stenotrophomonas maltophilia TaxID=40324 RepID=UPI0013DD645F|nr:hypothetical protein [Stenotrophomonas maltophilia]